MARTKTLTVLRFILAGIILVIFTFGVCDFLSFGYADFLSTVLASVRRSSDLPDYLNNHAVFVVFKIAKGLSILILLGVCYSLADFLQSRRTGAARKLDRCIVFPVTLFMDNHAWWRNLNRFARSGLAVMFLVHSLFLLSFLFGLPIHYDESYTYDNFIRQGLIQTATFYPLPNNHIFYNLVAGLFTHLPLPVNFAIRLPSFLAALLALWYFAKLAFKYFTDDIALWVTALYAASNAVLLYSFEARGYSFIVCCAVLQFYAANAYAISEVRGRYRFMFAASSIVGMYTVPSYLYTLITVNVVLGLWLILRKQRRAVLNLMFDNAIAGAIVLALYAPVIYFNGMEVLTNPNGANKLSIHDTLEAIPQHITSSWGFLTGCHIPLYWLYLAMAATLAGAFRKKTEIFLRLLVVGALIAPLPLLLLFRIIPFERTWVYLAVPAALCIGFFFSFLANLFPRLKRRSLTPGTFGSQALSLGLLVCLLVVLYQNFRKFHRVIFAIDYGIAGTFKKIRPDLAHIRTVGYTSRSLEWYVAEDLFFECIKANPYRPILLKGQDKTGAEDALILAPDSTQHYQLANYVFAGSYKNEFCLFLKK